MNILVIGDIIGEAGLNKAKEILPKLKQEKNIDFIIANGENSADGIGINEKMFNQMIEIGIDVITLGNHTWSKKDVFKFIDNNKILRPANYTKGLPGKGHRIYDNNNKKIAVINLIGRTDIGILSENPFVQADNILKILENSADIIIVDFHAEATAEKIAMGYYLDGRVNIVFGTHTHVQTADERILDKGTGYITDIGMTGPKESVIGMDISASIKRFVTTLPEKYKIAQGDCIFNGCIFQLNDKTCRMESVTRIYL